MAYLWRIYRRLRRRKGGTGFGSSPIEWPDIDAFVRNSRFPLTPWEIEVIEDLDDIYMAQIAGRPRSDETGSSDGVKPPNKQRGKA